MIEVVDPGPLTTVQDRGRPGLAHLGVSGSGAADERAFALVNHLVGNDADAAVLESTLSGPRLRFQRAAVVAFGGADAVGVSCGEAVEVRAGDVLDAGSYVRGVRLYVAVRGGLDVEPVLSSRSTDLLSGIGPAPLRAGDWLRVGNAVAERRDPAPVYALIDEPVLRVVPGPRADWFEPAALEQLVGETWRTSPSSNRVGIRLDGPALAWARDEELLSEAVVAGSLQVPRNGRPILLGPDHPTTGGYPVIAVVRSDDLWLAGQLRPGAPVRFELA